MNFREPGGFKEGEMETIINYDARLRRGPCGQVKYHMGKDLQEGASDD